MYRKTHICYFLKFFCSSARLVSGKSPGHHFWGTTNIAYMAWDRSDNSASCSFNVHVKGKQNTTSLMYFVVFNIVDFL